MRRGRKGWSRSNRNGRRGGESGWVSCSWPEPTLPQKAREGWGNLVRDVEWKGWDGPQAEDLVADGYGRVDWFKSKGPGYQTRINRILRRVMMEGKKRTGER